MPDNDNPFKGAPGRPHSSTHPQPRSRHCHHRRPLLQGRAPMFTGSPWPQQSGDSQSGDGADAATMQPGGTSGRRSLASVRLQLNCKRRWTNGFRQRRIPGKIGSARRALITPDEAPATRKRLKTATTRSASTRTGSQSTSATPTRGPNWAGTSKPKRTSTATSAATPTWPRHLRIGDPPDPQLP